MTGGGVRHDKDAGARNVLKAAKGSGGVLLGRSVVRDFKVNGEMMVWQGNLRVRGNGYRRLPGNETARKQGNRAVASENQMVHNPDAKHPARRRE